MLILLRCLVSGLAATAFFRTINSLLGISGGYDGDDLEIIRK
jgi:hypothetical protein